VSVGNKNTVWFRLFVLAVCERILALHHLLGLFRHSHFSAVSASILPMRHEFLPALFEVEIIYQQSLRFNPTTEPVMLAAGPTILLLCSLARCLSPTAAQSSRDAPYRPRTA